MNKKYFSGIAMGILMMSASSLYSQSANKKAYVLNYSSFDNIRFGSIPMTPPHTITSIGSHGKTILTDDLAEDGNLYAFDKNKRML